MEYKAFAFDIDGTLTVPGSFEYVESAVKAIRELQKIGKKIIICSGRPPQSINDIKNRGVFPDYFACSNANLLADSEGKVFFSNKIPRDVFEDVNEYCRKNNIGLFWKFESGLFAYVISDRIIELFSGSDFSHYYPNPDPEELPNSGTLTCSEEVKNELYDHFSDRIECVRGERSIYDINTKNYSKSIGLAKLLELIDVAPEQCMAFGDSENDIEMLKFAGMGVCMGDGIEICRKNADYVTAATYDDGILKALQHFGIL